MTKGHWNIRRIETIIGTPITITGEWFGQYETEQQAKEVIAQTMKLEPGTTKVRYEVLYMK